MTDTETGEVNISIHAPTRGATHRIVKRIDVVQISIHAPTRGATIMVTAAGTTIPNFNPRSHEGSDPSQNRPQ